MKEWKELYQSETVAMALEDGDYMHKGGSNGHGSNRGASNYIHI